MCVCMMAELLGISGIGSAIAIQTVATTYVYYVIQNFRVYYGEGEGWLLGKL